jgi:indolepyruvate ferredoxin oxidoreductase alpha subunit
VCIIQLEGAVTFKGPVGVNVASDALANLASSGVNGGALIIVGEDYGEGFINNAGKNSWICYEISVLAYGSSPKPYPSIVNSVKNGF